MRLLKVYALSNAHTRPLEVRVASIRLYKRLYLESHIGVQRLLILPYVLGSIVWSRQ